MLTDPVSVHLGSSQSYSLILAQAQARQATQANLQLTTQRDFNCCRLLHSTSFLTFALRDLEWIRRGSHSLQPVFSQGFDQGLVEIQAILYSVFYF